MSTTTNSNPTATDLINAVQSVREVVESAAAEAEEINTLPQSAVNAMNESGLFGMKLPAAFGGFEADPVTQLQVIEAMSYVDASAGWCLMIGASSVAFPAVFLSDEAVQIVFQGGRVPRASTSFVPTSTATPTTGGYLLSGRWPFASGIRHSQWINVGALLADPSGEPPQHRMFTIRTSDVQIHDNWDAVGLRGTGSCDFSMENVFVPQAFTYDLLYGEPKRGGPLYRLGIPAFFANEHAAFAFGVAQRALDTIVEASHTKARGVPPTLLVERTSFHRIIGECDLRLRAARSLVRDLNGEAWATVQAGSTPDLRLQTELRSSVAYATQVAVDVVTHAYRYAGGSAVHSSNLLQRCLRDINTAAQHLVVSDSAYENHGRLTLGLPGVGPLS